MNIFYPFRRISQSQFKRTPSNDTDLLSRKNSFGTASSTAEDNPESLHGASSRGSLYNTRSNTLPRGGSYFNNFD